MDEYKKPGVTVDVVLFACADVSRGLRKGSGKELRVLLAKRPIDPGKGLWSLPGGFISCDDGILLDTAQEKLKEKTGVTDVYLEQLKTFDSLDRDPRERVLSVSYIGLCHESRYRQGSGSYENCWFSLGEKELVSVDGTLRVGFNELAFDHGDIILEALDRLRGKVEYSDLVFELLPDEFTIKEIQEVFNEILGYRTDFFRRKLGYRVTETGKSVQRVGKPAKLFTKTPINTDYSFFGNVTPYKKRVIDKLRLDGVDDKTILKSLGG